MTILDVCNLALMRIGDLAITSLSDTTKQARIVSAFVHTAIDEVIRVFPWNCTIRRSRPLLPADVPAWVTLTAVTEGMYRNAGTTRIYLCVTSGTTGATAPTGTSGTITDGTAEWRFIMNTTDENLSVFTYRYLLPVDILRVLDLNGSKSAMYRIEGRILYTNETECIVRYAKKIDVDDMDPVLINAIVSRLASQVAYVITSNEQIAQLLYQEFAVTVSMARQVAAVEDREDMVDVLQLFTDAKIALARNSAQE